MVGAVVVRNVRARRSGSMSTTTIAAPLDETVARSPRIGRSRLPRNSGSVFAPCRTWPITVFRTWSCCPASFYIDMALRVDRELSERVPGLRAERDLRQSRHSFGGDTVIRVEVTDHGDGRVEYTFYEGGTAHGSSPRCRGSMPPGSKSTSRAPVPARPAAFSIEAFQAQAHAVIDSEQFYRTLRENGNQYGPALSECFLDLASGRSIAGESFPWRAEHSGDGPHCLHPSLLDSMTQLLAPFSWSRARPSFCDRSSDSKLRTSTFPIRSGGTPRCSPGARATASAGVGDVRVFDQSGKTVSGALRRLPFAPLDRVEPTDGKGGSDT